MNALHIHEENSVRNGRNESQFSDNDTKFDDLGSLDKYPMSKRNDSKIDFDGIVSRSEKVNGVYLKSKLTAEIDEVPSETLYFQKHNEHGLDDIIKEGRLTDEVGENDSSAIGNVDFKKYSQFEFDVQEFDKDTNDISVPRCKKHIVKIQAKDATGTNLEHSMKKKKIIWYDVPHNGHGLRNSVKNAHFSRCPPAARNCEILPPHITPAAAENVIDNGDPLHADAVIFHGCHLHGVPKLKRRYPDQVFVLAERENWYGNVTDTYFNNSHTSYYIDKFNWTMTYRRDSDIYMPYGQIVFNRRTEMKNYEGIFSKKKYSVVWMVSHCTTMSHREDFVKKLQKYIDVHIYGACGPYKCDKYDKRCLRAIIKSYKFVLSFENTYHTNYVTEKLFNWFPENIIPVVRGGETDYGKLGIPAGSIINADDYGSPEELAQDLRRIGNDEELYSRLLKRKAGYHVLSKDIMQERAYCELCKKLNDLDSYRQYYTHVGAWFSSDLNSETYCLK